MTQNQTPQPAPAQTTGTKPALPKTHPELQRLLDKEGGSIEYKPFGAEDSIRLTVKIVQDFLTVKTKSGKTCSERDARRFIMLCQAQRLNPWAGDAFLVGYDKWDKATQTTEPVFSLITAHVAFLKRAEASPDFEGMESGIVLIAEDGSMIERETDFALPAENVVGGWAKVYRRGRKPTYRRSSIAAFKPPYDSSFWSGDKAPGQICKVAEADALRSTFPTLLGGLYMQEEQFDISRIVADGKPSNKAELPGRGLVENVTPPAPTTPEGEEPEQKKPTPTPAQEPSKRAELEKFVLENGFTFTHLQRLGVEQELIKGADAMAGFDDIPESVAARLMRATTGLKTGLDAIKAKELDAIKAKEGAK